jgi:uncharacterized SAM-binding protein YcdF (DUF218 family)
MANQRLPVNEQSIRARSHQTSPVESHGGNAGHAGCRHGHCQSGVDQDPDRGCFAQRPRVLYCLYTSTICLTMLLVTAMWVVVERQQARTELVRSMGEGRMKVTDGVWRGVESVRSELCSSGSKLICATYEAVVVLGGGPAKDGSLPEWVKRRCDAAVELYKCCEQVRSAQALQGRESDDRLIIITTSAGTFHTPNVIDKDGFPITEARASSNYLVAHGVKHPDILEETSGGHPFPPSQIRACDVYRETLMHINMLIPCVLAVAAWDTIGNAWFTRTMHTDVLGIRRFLVITSDFHLLRSQVCSKRVALPSSCVRLLERVAHPSLQPLRPSQSMPAMPHGTGSMH